jgi:hypothetical protein
MDVRAWPRHAVERGAEDAGQAQQRRVARERGQRFALGHHALHTRNPLHQSLQFRLALQHHSAQRCATSGA